MSKTHLQPITCLQCKKESEFQFYDSINTFTDPNLKRLVKNYELFKFTCPHCGSEQFITYSFLYHQVETKLMIYVCQTPEEVAKVRQLFAEDDGTAENASGKREKVDMHGYRRRIVRNVDDLLEKVRIFEAKLDDRLIEIYKIFLYGQMQAELAAMEGGDEVEDVYFDEHLDGRKYFVFMNGDIAVGEVRFNKEQYAELQRRFLSVLDSADTEPVIDQDWAFAFLGRLNND